MFCFSWAFKDSKICLLMRMTKVFNLKNRLSMLNKTNKAFAVYTNASLVMIYIKIYIK
jgi:hypothetical protein